MMCDTWSMLKCTVALAVTGEVHVARKLMVLGSSPARGSFLLKNDCFGRVVLCCFAFLLCCRRRLAFLSSLEVIVHVCRRIRHMY